MVKIIAIISDTHENVFMIKKVVEILKKRNPEIVLHLGDVISPGTTKLFAGLKIKFIKGNCDGDTEGIKRVAESYGGEYLGEFAELEIKGKKIALYHGTDEERLNEIIKSGKYDYVLHGHFHERRDEKIGKTRVINPGNFYPGHEDHGFAFLDIEKDELEFVDIK